MTKKYIVETTNTLDDLEWCDSLEDATKFIDQLEEQDIKCGIRPDNLYKIVVYDLVKIYNYSDGEISNIESEV